jgi:hypothetical protein
MHLSEEEKRIGLDLSLFFLHISFSHLWFFLLPFFELFLLSTGGGRKRTERE